MNKGLIYALIILSLYAFEAQKAYSQTADKDKLGMALDYFQSGKYHEALLLFNKLDAKYTLSPRFIAYIGVCHYYEQDYKQAAEYLDKAMPDIGVFAPHERSIYYFTNAQSHFDLRQYDMAIPLYEQTLLVCYDNEKPDALYHLGVCHMFMRDWQNARDYLSSALAYYDKYPNSTNRSFRMAQIRNMIKGCDEQIQKQETKADTIATRVSQNNN